MKTTRLLFSVLLLSQVTFATNSTNKENQRKGDKQEQKIDVTKCCTRTAEAGTPRTDTYINVSITKCVTGATDVEAQQMACLWASASAGALIKHLAGQEATIVTIR